MRAIVFFLAAIPSAFVSQARADGCQVAVAALNKTVNAQNLAYAAQLRQIKGFGTPAMVAECPKIIALMQSRIAEQPQVQSLKQRAISLCGSRFSPKPGAIAGRVTSANMSPEQVIATAQQIISVCNTAMGQQSGAPASAEKVNDRPEVAAPAPPNQQSASCSDITGTGGSAGPSNCTPTSGVPANIQTQINQAQSYMQAAQTVKQSDSSASGQAAAAAQFRKAADAFRLAGELALARMAADQAQAIEATLSAGPQAVPQSSPQSVPLQDQRAALQGGDQQNSTPSDDQCPPAIPESDWQDGPNADYCAKASASCVDRGSALYGYLCAADATVAEQDPGIAAFDRRLRLKNADARHPYKPPISPQALRALAFSACSEKSLAEKPQCIENYELKILLGADGDMLNACASIADSIARHNKAVDEGPGPDWLKTQRRWVCEPDPDVRATCGSITNPEEKLGCVDEVYVNGPAYVRGALDECGLIAARKERLDCVHRFYVKGQAEADALRRAWQK
jgi:hypothetical protein